MMQRSLKLKHQTATLFSCEEGCKLRKVKSIVHEQTAGNPGRPRPQPQTTSPGLAPVPLQSEALLLSGLCWERSRSRACWRVP
jgi:hypothetical protein